MLERHPSEETARTELDKLIARRVPNWLPEAAARVAPFPLRTLPLLDKNGRWQDTFLITTAGFPAPRGRAPGANPPLALPAVSPMVMSSTPAAAAG